MVSFNHAGHGHVVLTIAVLVVCFAATSALTPITVKAPIGPIVGYVGPQANNFRGIPFAKPPIGDLRWAAPQPADPWTTPLTAQQDAPGCPQICDLPQLTCPPTINEDCLFLNVFTPHNATANSKLPVMVFVHGGDFQQGYAGGILYDGAWLASHHNVIIVAVQYRLGALGFLYTEYGFGGNYGILDQQEAFRWVQKNIAAFGGNPQMVTGFGQSAGAISIAVHMVVDSSEGLFQKAIMESEPFGLPFRTPKTWKDTADSYAKYAGCNKDSNYTECLMEASVPDLLGAQRQSSHDIWDNLSDIMLVFLPWTPTVGSPMLPDQPMSAFQAGNNHDIPFMIGTVWDEGFMFVYAAFDKPVSKTEYDLYLGFIFGVEDAIKVGDHFPIPSNETDDCRPTLSNIATQALFVCPVRNVSLIASAKQQQPVHVYHYDHIMSFHDFIWGKNYTICDTEVCHGAELVPLFHPKVSPYNVSYTPEEEVLSASLGTYWTNVAKTGSPGSFNGIEFKQFGATNQYTMLLETPTDTLMSKEFEDECAFWTQLDWWQKHV